jgi:hypothetical protein
MIYSGDLIKIGNTTIPNIVKYKVGRNKLWKDAERNMNGDVRATLIGIFPKIELEIGVCTQDEMATLTQLLDQDYFSVTWFDVRVGTTCTANYYAGDYSPELLSKSRGLYKPFTVNLIPVSKRGY